MFRKVLIANRGEIACRVIRTCQRLRIESIAVYSDADERAPHVRLADRALRLGPAPLKESYLNVPALLQAIEQSRAEAVHPGYGLLSENAEFARAVESAGATFVGPEPFALELLGDKIRARALARSVGATPPPGSDEPVDPAALPELVRAVENIGWPVLVKAASGGGGIGMQVARNQDELGRAVRTCADRGLAAFADGRVYIEKYLASPRHIEVQVFRDRFGNAVALGERECSVQRRHQKLIEESPSAAPFFSGEAGQDRRARLFAAALRIIEAADYCNAGTVEFVANDVGELFFLEVNARLQVEHPVTEMVTGLDLVELQLRVAAREPLSAEALSPVLRGHAIEARVYAEDPAKNFLPQPGTVQELTLPVGEGIRVDAGIETGSEVTPHYDPLLAKLIAHGGDRSEAIARLLDALENLELRIVAPKGPRAHNVDFLRSVLTSPEFGSAEYDTSLVERLLSRKNAR